MIGNKKIVVVLPAFNAAQTLRQTYSEIPLDIVDEVILTDDASEDHTASLAETLGIRHVLRHDKNRGYGANQKTCYQKAIELHADIVIMLHPDYQYTPKLIPSMAHMIANGLFEVVLGSRILGSGAVKGGMPVYKYVANRALTFFQNLMLGAKLSEFHTGYRAFSTRILKKINFEANGDGFIFDNQILSQIIYTRCEIGEITCPANYCEGSSSIRFGDSLIYGIGVLKVSVEHALQRARLIHLERYKTR